MFCSLGGSKNKDGQVNIPTFKRDSLPTKKGGKQKELYKPTFFVKRWV